MKTCSRCGETKPLEAFTRQKAGKDGYRASCRDCCFAYNAAYREAHREELRAYNARYRADNLESVREKARNWHKENRAKSNANGARWKRNNRDKVNAMKRAWAEKNPEAHRRHKRADYERNRDAYIARVRQWTKDNPEMRRAQILKRRGLEKNAAGVNYTTAQHIQWRIELYGGKCYYCGADADTIDHRISLVNGGSHWPANLVPCCRSCNSRKNKRNELEYRAAA